MRAAAPAKINLGLRVVGRRHDGYHELESIFLPLDLADELELEVRDAAAPAVTLSLDGPSLGVPAGADNLAVRAARGFLEAAGLGAFVRMRLRKRIPAAAGLGGGSSDAGAVLRALAEHFPSALAPGALADLALRLGADVPFFLDPRPAWVGGVGERIEPLRGVAPLALLLANPGLPLSTAEVFAAFDVLRPALAPRDPASSLRALSGRLGEPSGSALAAALDNDLEPAAVRLCPPIARLRTALRAAGAMAVGMSGSGPTVFGVFPDRAAAEAARETADFGAEIWVRVASTPKAR